jgi:NAD+ diphosphatase
MLWLPFHSPDGYRHLVAADSAREGYWFVFRSDRLLVEVAPGDGERRGGAPAAARLPFASHPGPLEIEALRSLYLGDLAGRHCFAAEVPAETEAPPGMNWEGLRGLFSVLDDAHFAIAGRALQLIDWDRSHQFCGRCGARTEVKPDERVRVCASCGLSAYPRVAPAVMALVRRGREVLLARGARFGPRMYSALAGFVEPGESLEQCVRREVAEEVGLEVTNLAYFASQPWPFPHSLMIAFTCEWAAGEIRPQPGEIEEAYWFDVFQLPQLPGKISIARGLIDAVTARIRSELETGDTHR